jgi:predicted ribosomally synthesized peptide with SipW-like signal peptide
MKKANKKLMISLAACGLIIAAGARTSLAFLTDYKEKTNTFTVGEVKISLTEPKYEEEEKTRPPMVPNSEIKKDPTIENVGAIDEIAFVAFDIPMANVIISNANGTVNEAAHVELFEFRGEDPLTYTSTASVNEGWKLVSKTVAADVDKDQDGCPDYVTYVYGYNKVIKATSAASPSDADSAEETSSDATVPPVFSYVRLRNVLEGQLTGSTLDIPVRAYAIQADYLQEENNGVNETIDFNADNIDKDTLAEIYQIFQNQQAALEAE